MDRWAIVAYIRALQRSQNASPDDLPPEQQAQLGVDGASTTASRGATE
jgi:hypothetical protein